MKKLLILISLLQIIILMSSATSLITRKSIMNYYNSTNITAGFIESGNATTWLDDTLFIMPILGDMDARYYNPVTSIQITNTTPHNVSISQYGLPDVWQQFTDKYTQENETVVHNNTGFYNASSIEINSGTGKICLSNGVCFIPESTSIAIRNRANTTRSQFNLGTISADTAYKVSLGAKYYIDSVSLKYLWVPNTGGLGKDIVFYNNNGSYNLSAPTGYGQINIQNLTGTTGAYVCVNQNGTLYRNASCP